MLGAHHEEFLNAKIIFPDIWNPKPLQKLRPDSNHSIGDTPEGQLILELLETYDKNLTYKGGNLRTVICDKDKYFEPLNEDRVLRVYGEKLPNPIL